ncbi:hypothetical protein E2562_003192 [Oryza meyeriana var. granulata]|uniref:Uncharacterized protein n=1 Tax=Oryza meyeriana var. granulata TaxID=110450 RepID=A0A6G1EUX8_9ORYZ|nr:hypothetical protein E2562_003192 [Oryza meyeriana var. granulata]
MAASPLSKAYRTNVHASSTWVVVQPCEDLVRFGWPGPSGLPRNAPHTQLISACENFGTERENTSQQGRGEEEPWRRENLDLADRMPHVWGEAVPFTTQDRPVIETAAS